MSLLSKNTPCKRLLTQKKAPQPFVAKGLFSAKKTSGFTLLELLVVMLLVGIMLTMTTGILFSEDEDISAQTDKLAHIATEARSRAILLNDSVELEISRTYLQIVHGEDILYELELENDVELTALNEEALGDDFQAISVHPLGIMEESIVWVQKGDIVATLHIPAIGRPVLYRDDYLSLETIHEDYL